MGLGVIGLGRAFAALAPSILAHPLVRLVAAADNRRDALRQCVKDFGANCHDSPEALFNEPSVEAVYVATPHQFHAVHAIAAMRAGKHVLVEKPMALTLRDCRRMTEAAARYKRHLIVGHTHSADPPVAKAAQMIANGRLGTLRTICALNYTDFLYRPRRPEELDTTLGGGAVFNQAPHHVDIVRLLGGGLVDRVRAVAGAWDKGRPTEGAYTAFLTFAGGAAATITYSGYARFDSDSFTGWIGETGRAKAPESHAATRRSLRQLSKATSEAAVKGMTGYGGRRSAPVRPHPVDHREQHHEHFGVVIASCDRADILPSHSGIAVYDGRGRRDIAVPPGRGGGARAGILDELYEAVRHDRAPLHSGAWGTATMEVCLAILRSSRTGREIRMRHQTPAQLAQDPS